MLDPTRGLREGMAGLTKNYAMLKRWPQYHLDAMTWMIDDRWQYQQMWPWGLYDNGSDGFPCFMPWPRPLPH